MRKGLVIWCMVVLPMMVVADERMCATGPCPNPVAGCVYTLNEGMKTRSFEVWGNVRVVSNPYEADVWVYVVKGGGGADLVVSWVENPHGCGQWHKVEKNEDFSVYFTDEERFASFTIRYGDADKEYPAGVLPY